MYPLAAAALLTAAVLPQPATAAADPLPPVQRLDLIRYAGTWHELASTKELFQIQCVGNTTAQYTPVDESTVGVVNSCDTHLKRRSTAKGTATVVDKVTNAQLRVRFIGVPAMGKGEGANYVVTHIADDYSWAVVGAPDRSSGWVLSRGVKLSPQGWDAVKTVLKARGFDVHAFSTTPVTGGETSARPL